MIPPAEMRAGPRAPALECRKRARCLAPRAVQVGIARARQFRVILLRTVLSSRGCATRRRAGQSDLHRDAQGAGK